MSENTVGFGQNPSGELREPRAGGSRIVSLREVGESLQDDIFNGQPPVEYAVASQAWGSLAFRPGEIIALAAPPGAGKTAFVMQTTLDALRLNAAARCLVVNVEMSHRKLYERQLARLSGIPLVEITRRENMLGRQYLLNRAIATMADVGDRMHFMTEPYRIDNIIDVMVEESRPDILVIDYLQRIECCEGVSDTRSRLNTLMQRFRTIAAAGVCVVLVCAVGRPSSKKGGGYNPRELGLASLRESSEIEYGCDDVYVMVPEGNGRPRNGGGSRVVLLKHEKSRNNSQQDLRFEFEGAGQRFRLLPPVEEFEDRDSDPGLPSSTAVSGRASRAGIGGGLLMPGDTFAEDYLDNNT